MLEKVQYELFAKDFKCPDFYTCNMVDSLKTCQDYLNSSVQSIKSNCLPVSTNFIEMVGKSCGYRGRNICYYPSRVSAEGPEKCMILVHNEMYEKIYQFSAENLRYAADNFHWFAIGCLTTFVLAYGSMKLMTMPPRFLEKANQEQFTNLLNNAEVSTGHWNGNQICFDGNQKATFTQVSNRIEEIYSESVDFMRRRQENYEWRRSNYQQQKRHGGIRGILTIGIPEAIGFNLEPKRPTLDFYEAQRVKMAMQWRKDRYAQLNVLFLQSQHQINKTASNFEKLWDKTVDKLGFWREVPCIKDKQILAEMGYPETDVSLPGLISLSIFAFASLFQK